MVKENPKVFISYSYDDPNYYDWVRSFSDRLIKLGIDIKLDQYDLSLTMNNPHFMEQGIAENDYVIILVTESYGVKAAQRKGGVGYETDLITGEIISGKSRKKFIPILVKINYEQAPSYLKGTNSLRIDNFFDYEDTFIKLYAYLTGQEIAKKPELGEIVPINDLLKTEVDKRIELLQVQTSFGLYYSFTLTIELNEFSDYTENELYHLYAEHATKNPPGSIPEIEPFAFNSKFKSQSTEEIRYITPNLSRFVNVKKFEELFFKNNKIEYSFYQLAEGEIIVFESFWSFSSILAILKMLKKLHERENKRLSLKMSVKFQSNKETYFARNEDAYFNTLDSQFEAYSAGPGKLEYSFMIDGLDESKAYRIFNRFTSNFRSNNPSSQIPYLVVDKSDFSKKYLREFQISS